MTRRGVRAAALCAVAGAAALAVVAGLIAPASATDVRVRPALFGVHDRTGASYAAVHEGSIRLWDTGVRWDEVETTKRHYDWTTLDALVADAQAHHAEATMVVAGTPSFYASDPSKPPRNLDAYKRFVRALMHRYRNFHGQRGIAAYQVWNEGNVATFWTGTPAQLARLTHAMWQVRNQVDRRAQVIAPPMVARLPYQQAALAAYDRQRVAGRPVWRYVDAAALSLYPLPVIGHRAGVPEDAMTILRQARARMRSVGVPARLPIWGTEINYGLATGSAVPVNATPISAKRQQANVARTYLLAAADRLARMFWYRYDMRAHPGPHGTGTAANSLLSDPADPSRLTAGGRAFVLVRSWMHGTMLGSKGALPCARDAHGTYLCVVKDGSTVRRIYWNPFRKATVHLAANAREAQSITGATRRVRGGSRLAVTYLPVMVTR